MTRPAIEVSQYLQESASNRQGLPELDANTTYGKMTRTLKTQVNIAGPSTIDNRIKGLETVHTFT